MNKVKIWRGLGYQGCSSKKKNQLAIPSAAKDFAHTFLFQSKDIIITYIFAL